MKKKTLSIMLTRISLLFVLSGFSLQALCQSDEYVVRNTVSTCLNVRTDHNTDADEIACLDPGTKVKVINTVPFWREITFGDNQHGWVAKKYIEPVTSPAIADAVEIPEDAVLTVHFIDVGQGDAIWIQTHDDKIDGNGIFEGYSIIIDGGPYSSDNNNPLREYIESVAFHGAPIEALIVTHPHDDHYSGAEMISRHFAVNHYYDPGYPTTSSSYHSFIKTLKGEDGNAPRAKNIHIGKSGFDKMNWGAELKVEVLYSWVGDSQNTLGSGSTEANNASIVVKLHYGDHSFLFMGDAEGKSRTSSASTPKYVEKVLLETASDKLKSTVLKIAHHGSETSSTIPFIQAVDPEIVVVQSGRKSFSGRYLPDLTTLQRYCAHNPAVKIYRTDQGDEQAGYSISQAVDDDHIVIRTNGKGTPEVKALNGGQPFNSNFCNPGISFNEND